MPVSGRVETGVTASDRVIGRVRHGDDASAVDATTIHRQLRELADRLVPKGLGRAALCPGMVLEIVALVQDQSHEEIPGVADVNEEPRHELLALEFPLGEPLEGFPLDVGQVVLE